MGSGIFAPRSERADGPGAAEAAAEGPAVVGAVVEGLAAVEAEPYAEAFAEDDA